MDTWDGEFGWKFHARTGRPDLLNYLRQGDFTWPDLWLLYDQLGVDPLPAVTRAMGLFHQYVAWQFDLNGGLADPDGEEVLENVMSWSRFCVRNGARLPDTSLRDQLINLVEAGSISPGYYEYAYQCHLRALVENHSRTWASRDRPLESGEGLDEITPCRGYGKLRVYIPEDSPELSIAGDLQWQRFKRAVAQRQHDAWCASYASLIERLEEMSDERPAL